MFQLLMMDSDRCHFETIEKPLFLTETQSDFCDIKQKRSDFTIVAMSLSICEEAAMSYELLCVLVFSAAYTVNLIYISVFFHRGLAHRAVNLRPWLRRWVIHSGNWIIGIDPLAWACMHRLHHAYADTEKDPHSPHNSGILPLALTQLYVYKRVLRGLIRREKAYTSRVMDLDFPVSWLNRRGLWMLPYVLQAAIAVFVALLIGWAVGLCYFIGIASHPVQGWLVNAFGHAWGYRNFATKDRSVNNTLIAWLVFGEGYQNNHHYQPRSAKFSAKWWEVDPGYGLCLLLEGLGLISIRRVT